MHIYYYILGETYYKMTGEMAFTFRKYFYDLGKVHAENITDGGDVFDFQMTHATPFKLFIVKEVF